MELWICFYTNESEISDDNVNNTSWIANYNSLLINISDFYSNEENTID